MNDDTRDDTLRKAIDSLPREAQPVRDLWPGIAERIGPPRRRIKPWPMAAAVAGFIAIGAIAATITLSLHPREVQGPAATQTPTQPAPLHGPRMESPRARVLAATVRRNTRLAPKTRAVLLKNLAIIEGSIANIQRALSENPGNAGLQPLLYQLYRDEAALLAAAQRVHIQTTTGVIAL